MRWASGTDSVVDQAPVALGHGIVFGPAGNPCPSQPPGPPGAEWPLRGGAFLGGLVPFPIVALAALAEPIAAESARSDRVVARVLRFVAALVGWLALLAIGLRVDLRIGG